MFKFSKKEVIATTKCIISKQDQLKSFDKEEINIHFGLFTQNLDGTPHIVRGKVLPLKINKPRVKFWNLHWRNKKKHDHTFQKDREYKLLYPAGQIVNNLSGINEPFTLIKYKEDIGKQFVRITLHLSSTLEQSNEYVEEIEKLNATSSSISQFTTWHQSGNDLNDSHTIRFVHKMPHM